MSGSLNFSDDKARIEIENLILSVKKALGENSFAESECNQASYAPARVALAGSFLLRTVVDGYKNIDLVAYMPDSWCDDRKLSSRNYLSIRQDYISYLYSHLITSLRKFTESEHDISMCLSYAEKTCVSISFPGHGCSVNLHTALDTATIKRYHASDAQFWKLPDNLLQVSADLSSLDDETYQCLNQMEDSSMEHILHSIHQVITLDNEVARAIILLKNWLITYDMRRKLPSHILSLLVCAMSVGMKENTESASNSRLDALMRKTIALLTDFEKLEIELRKLILRRQGGKTIRSKQVQEPFDYRSPPHNFPVTFHVSIDTIHQIASFAKDFNTKLESVPSCTEMNELYLSLVKNCESDVGSIFPPSSLNRFLLGQDAFFSIYGIEKYAGARHISHFIEKVLSTVKYALEGRAAQVDYFLHAKQHTNERMRGWSISYTLYIGVCYVSFDAAYMNITKGPLHGSDASVFQEFWGPQSSEYRRFADGSVHLTRVWSDGPKEGIVTEIIRDALHRHHNIPNELIYQHFSYFETAVLSSDKKNKSFNKVRKNQSKPVKRDAQCHDIRTVFRNALGALQNYMYSAHEHGFPVKIQSFFCAHPYMRDTSIQPPMPHASLIHFNERKEYKMQPEDVQRRWSIPSIPVTIELGKHALWPNNIEAVDHLIGSLAVDLCLILRKQYGVVCIPNAQSIHIIILGYAFSVSIWYPKMAALCKAVGNSGRSNSIDHANKIVPAHHAYMRKAIEENEGASTAIRSLLRLVNIHMPVQSIPHEVVELFVAKQLLICHPSVRMRHPFVLLILTLDFIARADFDKTIDLRVQAHREGPHHDKHALHFITPYSDQSPFTESGPSKEALQMLKEVATWCLQKILSAASCPSLLQRNYFKSATCLRDPNCVLELWKRKAQHVSSIPHLELHHALREWRALLLHPFAKHDFAIELRSSVLTWHHPSEESLSKGKQLNIYEKGLKERSELLHSFLSFNPVQHILQATKDVCRGELEVYHDSYGSLSDMLLLRGTYLSTTYRKTKRDTDDECERTDMQSKVQRIVSYLGDAVQFYEVRAHEKATRLPSK